VSCETHSLKELLLLRFFVFLRVLWKKQCVIEEKEQGCVGALSPCNSLCVRINMLCVFPWM